MKFYTEQHRYYCGIDLHARSMYVCVLDQQGKKLVHRKLPTEPAPLLRLLEPHLEDVVVAVECLFCWYWLADLCAAQGIRFVLGHALYMKAIHGGKSKNDKIDSYKIAALLRGGNLPQAYVYPAEMRAARDLLRRRLFFVRHRAGLLAHTQMTVTQYNLPSFEKRIDHARHRDGLLEHFEDEDVQMSMAANLEMIESYERSIAELELFLEKRVKVPDASAYYLLRSVPGIGKIFLDDVPTPRARRVAAKYESLLVETFPAGGCHIWLACRAALAEAGRRAAQRWPRPAAAPRNAGWPNASEPTPVRCRGSTWDVWRASRTGSAAATGSTSWSPRPTDADGTPLPSRRSRQASRARRTRRRRRRTAGESLPTPAPPAGSGPGSVASWRTAVHPSVSTSGCLSRLACAAALTRHATLGAPSNELFNAPATRARTVSTQLRR